MVADKTSIISAMDRKVNELAALSKELDKTKDEINSRDMRMKWTQNKLNQETELHKVC